MKGELCPKCGNPSVTRQVHGKVTYLKCYAEGCDYEEKVIDVRGGEV